MRAVLHQDVVALARCLLPLAPADRRRFADLQIVLSNQADVFRAEFGRIHPFFGNGTLMSCCSGHQQDAERRIDDPDYADCMIKALEAILAFRSNTPQQ
ncbi:hypothetical protein GGE09_003287 [Roseobacter sp. N2S]|nr:hypothetical protein [Amylibacter sp.]MDR6266271.1 hypothetical protein [Roseobacter sp. N2S]